MDSHKGGVCLFAWRCLRYTSYAAACNLEGGGSFCGEWRKFNGHRPIKHEAKTNVNSKR
ncbi:hypothetical protein IH574_04985 [Candidatus Bathyarchaeota archaeon]|nr:hypothetical protein [Candidatus Bathyarchaeota archaeon]